VENFNQEAALVMAEDDSGAVAFCDFNEIGHNKLELKELGAI
jgi:hypothetical protein